MTLEQIDREIEIHKAMLKHLRKMRRNRLKDEVLTAEAAKLKQQIR